MSSGIVCSYDEEGENKRKERVVDKALVDSALINLVPQDHDDVMSNITRHEIEHCRDALFFDGVLTEDECQQLIGETEKIGYTFWNPDNEEQRSFRSAYTVETHHEAIANLIFHRIRSFLVQEVCFDDEEDSRWSVEFSNGVWRPYGVNPVLLFGRYRDSGHFGPHSDGSTVIDINHRSLWTVLVYLKSTMNGGRTFMISDQQRNHPMVETSDGKYSADPKYIIKAVEARAGRALVFWHEDMHEGEIVGNDDEKYFIRTDVLYRREPPILTSTEDQEAFRLWQQGQLLAEQGDSKGSILLFERCFKKSEGLAKLLGQA